MFAIWLSICYNSYEEEVNPNPLKASIEALGFDNSIAKG
jgi:hypothetical protein